MSGIIDVITQLFNAAIGWVGDVAGLITGATEGVLNHPILLVFCALPLVGLGVGLFKRLISVR